MIWQVIIKFIKNFKMQSLHKGIFILFVLLGAGSTIYSTFESKPISESIWWAIVTITTVGYGDIFPITTGGKIIAVILMTSGIGILGAITAALAGFLMEKRLMELKGMKNLNIKNHIILCGWNHRGIDIIEEIKSDIKYKNTEIAVIADYDKAPFQIDDSLFFIKGEINRETLEKACCKKAFSALVLSNEKLNGYANDAKSILACLTIKHINQEVYTSVELIDSKNIEQCEIAGADEIIVSGKMATNLLVQSILDHGISQCINELLSNKKGQEFYKIDLPEKFIGKNFAEIITSMKEEREVLIIGIEFSGSDKIITNPSSNTILKKGDKLVVIAESRPDN